MRRIAGLALSLALLAPFVSAAAAAAGPFSGTWFTNDTDGSKMRVDFSGSGATRSVTYKDFRATLCGGDKWVVQGTGTVTGHTITASLQGGCVGDPPSSFGNFTWTHSPGFPALIDQEGLVWMRASVVDAFNGVWRAVDPADDSQQRMTLTGTGLNKDVDYVDFLASICNPDAIFVGHGSGTVGSTPGQGSVMDVEFSGRCAGQPEVDVSWTFEYDVSTNTMSGGSATWYR